jgi:hypothetical protein
MEGRVEEIEEIVVRGVAVGLAFSLLGVLLLLVPLAIPGLRVHRRRHFWCAWARQKAEVEFEERGLPGLRRSVAVVSCSCFDPPTEVGCGRRCLDSAFRRQWPSSLPIGGTR